MTTYDNIMSYLRAAIPEFTNTSGAAIDKKIASSLAPVIDNTLTELTNTQTVIEDIIGQQRYGKTEYYTRKALEFQYGTNLVYGDGITVNDVLDPVYTTINTTQQIIKQAALDIAISGNNQILTLKVAKKNALTGKLEALETAEKTAFDSYMGLFEIPGLPVNKSSSDPNKFSFIATITYYATYDYSVLIANITNALTTFRDDYTFNGVLYVNDFEDYLKQNIPGIRNASLSNTTMTNSSGIATPFTSSVILSSGYFDYDPSVTPTNFSYVPI